MAGWLLFFSSLPSKPAGNRVKLWRRLAKAGAVQLKGSVYALPDRESHRELFQWLCAEVAGMGGEAAFVRVGHVETVPDAEIAAAFERRTAEECRRTGDLLETLAGAVERARQAGAAPSAGKLSAGLDRAARRIEEARRTDFFASPALRRVEEQLARLRGALDSLAAAAEADRPAPIPVRSAGDYRGRRWLTRRAPGVDRMASAWLIRRFVDPDAAFGFLAGDDAAGAAPGEVVFDAAGGEFTHVGDRCTFEVLARSFGIGDEAAAGVAEIVHDLDLEDDRYRRAEAPGVAGILEGIRRTSRDDGEALERGMAVFEALYAAQGRATPRERSER